MTVQSPSSQARTSVSLPTICRFATYSGPRNLFSQLARNEDAILLDRRARPWILIRELSDFPSARIGVDVARLDPWCPGPPGLPGARNPQGTPSPERNVAISLRTGEALGKVHSSSTYTRV